MHFFPRYLLAATCVFVAATTLSAQTASVLTAEYDKSGNLVQTFSSSTPCDTQNSVGVLAECGGIVALRVGRQ